MEPAAKDVVKVSEPSADISTMMVMVNAQFNITFPVEDCTMTEGMTANQTVMGLSFAQSDRPIPVPEDSARSLRKDT